MTDPAEYTYAVHRLAPFTRELGIIATSVDSNRVEARAKPTAR